MTNKEIASFARQAGKARNDMTSEEIALFVRQEGRARNDILRKLSQ
jgi:hypothetical protein